MTRPSKREELEDILQAYMDSVREPSYASLVEWIAQYPEYQEELTDFAVAWRMVEFLPAADHPPTDSDTLVLRGMSIVENILHQKADNAPPVTASPSQIVDLLGQGKRLGLSVGDIATRVRLSVAILRKFNQRLIQVNTVPRQAIQMLADTLQQKFETILDYLQQAPTLQQQFIFKAEQAPQIGTQQSFFEAVRTDTGLDEADRNFWLAFETDLEQ